MGPFLLPSELRFPKKQNLRKMLLCTLLGIVISGIRRQREGGKAGQMNQHKDAKYHITKLVTGHSVLRDQLRSLSTGPSEAFLYGGRWKRKEEACICQLLFHNGQRLAPGGMGESNLEDMTTD